MFVNNIVKIFFSPTRSTEKIVNVVTQYWENENQRIVNLNSIKHRYNFSLTLQENELVFLGIPVYEGKIPNLLYPVLYKIRGKGHPIVLIVTYGNINPGIAIKQLYAMMKRQGFNIIAAGIFVGEHSFSYGETKIASGRPDKKDIEQASLFGLQIKQKLASTNQVIPISESSIRGYLPVFDKLLPTCREILFPSAPIIQKDICKRCGKCLDVCPVDAINPEDYGSKYKLCIKCFACVKFCPNNARKIIYKKPVFLKTILKQMGEKRKEPEIYI